jgi:mannobiose 2-epimerase
MRRALLLLALAAAACAPEPPEALGPARRIALGDEAARLLEANLMAAWYPRAIDTVAGGYLSDFDADWNAAGPQRKMIVTQARHVWTTARAGEFLGDPETWVPRSAHGVDFLARSMWDGEHGGFFWMVTREGAPVPEPDGRLLKQAYGNAFAIYGLAAYADVSGDPGALSLARRAFGWLDAHAHDPVHGGYFNYLERDGTPLRAGLADRPADPGYDPTPPKDQNSSIHLLEAFTELYRVWPDSVLRERLAEMLHLVRDTIVAAPGTLQLYFLEDWTPVSYRDSSETKRRANEYLDHVSFGHDVETAYLMLEAAEALGDVDEVVRSLGVGKRLVDHALRYGWDRERGGFVDAGYYLAGDSTLTVLRDTKNWWAQAEGLNTLLLLGDLYPEDALAYHARFLEQWAYVSANLIDHERGGWYEGGLDRQPGLASGPKAHIWKAAYHEGRALMNVARRLGGGG